MGWESQVKVRKYYIMRVALVHDYLREYGGAERVLEELHHLYPDAPVYTAFFDQKALGIQAKKFQGWDIRQSFITKIPFYKRLYSPLRIFAPQFFRSFDMNKYDLIISSSNMYFAKAIKKRKNAIHISYCHTPPRALYGYTTQTNWKKNPIIKIAGTLINHYLRVVDYQVSQKVDYFICNSKEVQKRIQKFYRRDASIIYPPVNVDESLQNSSSTQLTKNAQDDKAGIKSSPALSTGGYYLFVGRLAFAKHPEMAVEAANRLGIPLKVVGTGGMFNQLKEIKGDTVELLGAVSDEKLKEVYQSAKALIFPVEDEDFGIVPVEAMGHGVPVIAHNSGGPKETINDGQTGILFEDLSVVGLIGAIKKLETLTFDPQKIHQHALQFTAESFQMQIRKFVEVKYNSKRIN